MLDYFFTFANYDTFNNNSAFSLDKPNATNMMNKIICKDTYAVSVYCSILPQGVGNELKIYCTIFTLFSKIQLLLLLAMLMLLMYCYVVNLFSLVLLLLY